MTKKISKRIAVSPLTDRAYKRALHHSRPPGPLDVVRAHYDLKSDSLDLSLRNGILVRFPRSKIRELAQAQPHDLKAITVQPGGDGLTFRSIDVDISVAGLLADELGTLFARAMGRRARGQTSRKKAISSRLNGQKGGRPKKKVAA